jgi:hypothetical protein
MNNTELPLDLEAITPMELVIRIKLDNASFAYEDAGPEVAAILQKFITDIDRDSIDMIGEWPRALRDTNGNTVGSVEVVPTFYQPAWTITALVRRHGAIGSFEPRAFTVRADNADHAKDTWPALYGHKWELNAIVAVQPTRKRGDR